MNRIGMVIVSGIIFALILAVIPLSARLTLKKMGKQLLSLSRKNPRLQILSLTVCALVLVLLVFRDLGMAGNAVICVTVLLGAGISFKDVIFNSFAGVYANGLIADGKYLFASDMLRLCNSETETGEQYSCALCILTVNKQTVTFSFNSEEEKETVLKEMKANFPALKD